MRCRSLGGALLLPLLVLNCEDEPQGRESGCGADEFVDFTYDWCSTRPQGEDLPAECKSRSASCENEVPVCGCDGNVYDSQCAAQQAGVDIGGGSPDQDPHCEATPAGRFPCGPWYCDPKVSYCDYGQGDAANRAVSCAPWPASCAGQRDCACLKAEGFTANASCADSAGNGVTGTVVTEYWQ